MWTTRTTAGLYGLLPRLQAWRADAAIDSVLWLRLF